MAGCTGVRTSSPARSSPWRRRRGPVGIGLRNSPAPVLAAFAAWKLGAVPVPVRWDLPDWELPSCVRSRPRIYLAEKT